MCAPIQMKKDRPGVLLTVLCDVGDADRFSEMILRETSALGVRRHNAERRKLQREQQTVDTPLGRVRVKVGRLNGEIVQASPEYECREIAANTKRAAEGRLRRSAKGARKNNPEKWTTNFEIICCPETHQPLRRAGVRVGHRPESAHRGRHTVRPRGGKGRPKNRRRSSARMVKSCTPSGKHPIPEQGIPLGQ